MQGICATLRPTGRCWDVNTHFPAAITEWKEPARDKPKRCITSTYVLESASRGALLDTIDKNCPGGNGWQPEHDEYYGFPTWVAPTVGATLIPVGGKSVAIESTTKVVTETEEVDEANIADQD